MFLYVLTSKCIKVYRHTKDKVGFTKKQLKVRITIKTIKGMVSYKIQNNEKGEGGSLQKYKKKTI